MTAAIVTFAVLLGVYALIIWATRPGGPADPNDMWDEPR